MSFLKTKITHKKPYKVTIRLFNRKENDSLFAIHFPLIIHKKEERASAFTSKGSLTLEAALVVPCFLFAMLCLVCLLEMMCVQTAMRNALYSVARELAEKAYQTPLISTESLEQQIVDHLDEEKINNSIDCSNSKFHIATGIMELSLRYNVKIPVPLFGIPVISREETMRVKGWTGYAKGTGQQGGDSMVYITDYGLVYHKNIHCTYLELSIQAVGCEEIEELRNESGGKYYPCESCGDEIVIGGRVYITSYGTRYHTSLECSRVKRNIYEVPIDEAYGLGGCSKCVD